MLSFPHDFPIAPLSIPISATRKSGLLIALRLLNNRAKTAMAKAATPAASPMITSFPLGFPGETIEIVSRKLNYDSYNTYTCNKPVVENSKKHEGFQKYSVDLRMLIR